MVNVGLVDDPQHRSVSGRSTVTQLIQQQKDILDILEDGYNLEFIYLDFAKAYDKVYHRILLSKIQNIGVIGNTLGSISHWLCSRTQRVRVGQELSDWDVVQSGVPQGSVLGPLMFLIFIWDLQVSQIIDPEAIRKIYKYVDDTKIVSSTKNTSDTISLQESLDEIYEWQVKNNM